MLLDYIELVSSFTLSMYNAGWYVIDQSIFNTWLVAKLADLLPKE